MKTKKHNRQWPPTGNLEVTIHSPLPQKQWPFRKGTRVWYISQHGICDGRVRWYNPALKGNCIVTKGRPFFTMDNGDCAGIDQVQRFTHNGKAALLEIMAKGWDDHICTLRKNLADAEKMADKLRNEARVRRSTTLTLDEAANLDHYCPCCRMISFERRPKINVCEECGQEGYECCVPRKGAKCPYCLVEKGISAFGSYVGPKVVVKPKRSRHAIPS